MRHMYVEMIKKFDSTYESGPVRLSVLADVFKVFNISYSTDLHKSAQVYFMLPYNIQDLV